jgi:hypothetical protein
MNSQKIEKTKDLRRIRRTMNEILTEERMTRQNDNQNENLFIEN